MSLRHSMLPVAVSDVPVLRKRATRGINILTVMELTRPVRGYWEGLAWVLGAYVLIQFMYRIPRYAWESKSSVYLIAPFWYLLSVVYLWIGERLRRLDVRWVYAVWHILHILLIGCNVGILGYRKIAGELPYVFTSTARGITEFLISPVLYITLGLLYRAPRS